MSSVLVDDVVASSLLRFGELLSALSPLIRARFGRVAAETKVPPDTQGATQIAQRLRTLFVVYGPC